MAGDFLLMASRGGFSVSKGVIASWARYQKKAVQDYRSSDKIVLGDLEQAYRLYTLALKGEPESGAMNRLKESEHLSSQAAWMLASAYSITGKKNVAKEITNGKKVDFSEYSETGRTFGSPVRDKAIALGSSVLMDEIPQALDIAQEVARAMSDGWYTTQEAAFSSAAMNLLAGKVATGPISTEVTQTGSTTPVKSTKSVCNVQLDTESGGVDIKNLSDGGIYATLATSTLPKSGERTEARSNGLSLDVNYISREGKVLNPAEIPQGTDFSVSITVGNTSGIKDYTHLALTEMVPSGWEISNDRMYGAPVQDVTYDYQDIRDDRVIWFFDLPRGTAKTFKVNIRASYEGEFNLPPVKCEAMYDSKVSANTASGTAKVSN